MPAENSDCQASVRRFVFDELPAIDGYLEPQDALIMSVLAQAQQNSGLPGSIIDIGVYFGRSYFLFRKAAGPETQIVGIDLFDSQSIGSREDQYSTFLKNGHRLGLPVDERLVIAGDSTKLSPSAILEKCGKARFVSIDGGHGLHQVKSDGELARQCLFDHGVIAFDDMHNPLWPEVTVAVADFFRAHQGMFCVVGFSRFRSYVCRTDYRDFYRDILSNSPCLQFMEKEEVAYLGSKALFLRVPMSNRLLHALFQRLKLPGLAELTYSRPRRGPTKQS